MPLNHELIAFAAVFVEQTTAARAYGLYALSDTIPARPGLSHRLDGSAAPLSRLVPLNYKWAAQMATAIRRLHMSESRPLEPHLPRTTVHPCG
jgi:hypothetical protein